MLTEYIQAAMRRAHYELIDDENAKYCGTIPGLQGVIACGMNLEECREELQGALEGWIHFRYSDGMDIPPIDGIDISLRKAS